MNLTEARVTHLLSGFRYRRIAIVGDVMLDRYYRGTVSRISPEAPVPIVDILEESEYPGGAANVAYNLATLGADPMLMGIVGDDLSGEQLRTLLSHLGISHRWLLSDSARPTTVKTRVIAASQHIVRVDRETKRTASAEIVKRLIEQLAENISCIDAIILQDYNKGVVTSELIPRVVELARFNDVPVYVDPKLQNFFNYTGVTVFKPNRKEAEDALERELRNQKEQHGAVQELLTRLGCEHVVLTLGSEGMMVARHNEEPTLIPTRAIQVADVSGAGDTVIATLATARAAGASMYEAAIVANHAAGIVCEQVGTVPVGHGQLLAALLDDSRKSIETG